MSNAIIDLSIELEKTIKNFLPEIKYLPLNERNVIITRALQKILVEHVCTNYNNTNANELLEKVHQKNLEVINTFFKQDEERISN